MKSKSLLLITCFLFLSPYLVQAALPITLSTDTGEGAVWYYVKNLRATQQGKGAYMKAVDYNQNVIITEVEESDAFLWCFVGTSETNLQIYNKAFPDNGARLVDLSGKDGGVNGWTSLTTADTEWDYSWSLIIENDLYGFLPGSSQNNLLHGTEGEGVLFYGHSVEEAGCAWIFEDGTTPIQVDFTNLIALIEEYTTLVNADKADQAKAEKYAEGISIFEKFIAEAQEVVDNPEATQANVNAALNELRKANYNYRLVFVDLPFTISKEGEMVWYKIKNIRRANNGYLTYTNGVVETTATENTDSQAWAFTGNNTIGINIYNKADMESGAKLISVDNVLTISSSSWEGAWKLDRKIYDGAYCYGICDANGRYNDNYESNDFLHGMLDGGVVFYGFDDEGSLWGFEPYDPTSIKDAISGEVSIFSQNGIIYFTGAEGEAKVISMTGQAVVVDANTPYVAPAKGIYIVQVGNIVHKVVVQ